MKTLRDQTGDDRRNGFLAKFLRRTEFKSGTQFHTRSGSGS